VRLACSVSSIDSPTLRGCDKRWLHRPLRTAMRSIAATPVQQHLIVNQGWLNFPAPSRDRDRKLKSVDISPDRPRETFRSRRSLKCITLRPVAAVTGPGRWDDPACLARIRSPLLSTVSADELIRAGQAAATEGGPCASQCHDLQPELVSCPHRVAPAGDCRCPTSELGGRSTKTSEVP